MGIVVDDRSSAVVVSAFMREADFAMTSWATERGQGYFVVLGTPGETPPKIGSTIRIKNPKVVTMETIESRYSSLRRMTQNNDQCK